MNLLLYLFLIINFISGIVLGRYIKININRFEIPHLEEDLKTTILLYGSSSVFGIIPALFYKLYEMPQDFGSNLMLVIVNLVGFCGLINTFVFGKLLDEKSKLEQYDREIYLSDLEMREKYRMNINTPGPNLKILLEEYKNKEEEIGNKIELNINATEKAYNLGIRALSFIFASLIGILFLYMIKSEYDYIVMWLSMSLLFAGFFKLIICIRVLINPLTI